MAKTIKTQLGKVEVLLEVIDVESADARPGFEPISRKDQIKDFATEAYDDLFEIVKEFSTKMETTIKSLQGCCPNKLELELGMTFGAQAGLWVVTAKGEGAVKVKLSWDGLTKPPHGS